MAPDRYRNSRMARRVVVTGIGAVSPNGVGRENFWRATREGVSGVRRISRFDASRLTTQIAGEIPDFDPEAFGLTELVGAGLAVRRAVARHRASHAPRHHR